MSFDPENPNHLPIPMFSDFQVSGGRFYALNTFLYVLFEDSGELHNIYGFYRGQPTEFFTYIGVAVAENREIFLGGMADDILWVGKLP